MQELSVKFLQDQILDETSNPTTFIPDIDQLAAFRLLVHAEIEHFLEAKALENIDALNRGVGGGGGWMRSFPALLPLALILEKNITKEDVTDRQKMSNYVLDIIASAKKKISENNSIKNNAFFFLAICFGKTVDEIDSVLAGNLNSFGKDRGQIAHNTARNYNVLLSPSSELANVNSIIGQISSFYDVV
jgi:hypothetical protein